MDSITSDEEKAKPHRGYHIRTLVGLHYFEGDWHYITPASRIDDQECRDRLSDAGYASSQEYIDHCTKENVSPFGWFSKWMKNRGPELTNDPTDKASPGRSRAGSSSMARRG